MIMLDLDHFKKTNDEHGHDSVDTILVEFSATLCPALRDADIPARWGGEGFIALLPNPDESTAIKLAHRIHSILDVHDFGKPATVIARVTTSICAVQCSITETINQCFKRLDSRLYEARQAGRNCIIPGGNEHEIDQ